MRRGTVFYVGAAKPAVCYDDAHLDPDYLYAIGEKWISHSVLALPAQRPARSNRSGVTLKVQGAQPMEG